MEALIKRKSSTNSDKNDKGTKKLKPSNLEHANVENGENGKKIKLDSVVEIFLFVYFFLQCRFKKK